MKRHYITTAPDGTKFTSSAKHSYTHAVLVWCQTSTLRWWKWSISSFCESVALASKASSSTAKVPQT